ncbi:MAG TPA: hypothetical protein GXZ23_03090 [Clostridiales bacterium]|nr:hypothetical protein [Clostridiales bacterium]
MKLKILSVILSMLILSSCITLISSATEYTLGDVTGDGKIKTTDARLILRASMGLEIFEGARAKAADLNGDGKIKPFDARIALRIAMGLDDLNNYTTVPETIETTPNTTEATIIYETTTEITTETVTVPITTTQAPTTDAPTEIETDEPTEEESEIPTEAPKDGQLNFYQKYYVDCVAYDETDVGTATPLRFATDGKSYYARTTIDDKDTGFIIKKVIGGRDLYMINYNTNQYLVMGNALLGMLKGVAGDGLDLDAMIADSMGEIQMAVPYITSYDAMAFDEFETIDGVQYAVCNTVYNGLPMKVYFREGETNAAITKIYTNDDKLIQTIVFNEINSKPDDYFKAPKGMKKITFSLFNMDAAMNFMESFG